MTQDIYWIKKLKIDLKRIMLILCNLGIFNVVNDEKYLKFRWRLVFDSKLNLKNPQTFNEKLQWLKLNNKNQNYSIMSDKIAVKEYVGSIIGEEYIIPTINIWDSIDDIDFSNLPNQFVIKCNHNSGLGMYICKDKNKTDENKIKKNILKGLKQDYYKYSREWSYKNIKPRIICEKLMIDESEKELKDYKLMCFNGKVKCTLVCSDRNENLSMNFYDNNWNLMPLKRKYPNTKYKINKPVNFNKMIELAEILSKDIPFVRVDFYEINNQIYFGELTFYPGAGFEKFYPQEYDYILGSWIKLPK